MYNFKEHYTKCLGFLFYALETLIMVRFTSRKNWHVDKDPQITASHLGLQ